MRSHCTCIARRSLAGCSMRSGVIFVEAALILSVLLLLMLMAVDLSLAVLRHNTLSEVTRKLTREAIVHGAQAAKTNRGWGPAAWQGTAADDAPQAVLVRGLLATIDPRAVRLRVDWIDGGHALDQRVRVTANLTYVPIFRLPFFRNRFELTATSVMRITY